MRTLLHDLGSVGIGSLRVLCGVVSSGKDAITNKVRSTLLMNGFVDADSFVRLSNRVDAMEARIRALCGGKDGNPQ